MKFTYQVKHHGDMLCVLVHCDGGLLGQLLMTRAEWTQFQKQHFVSEAKSA